MVRDIVRQEILSAFDKNLKPINDKLKKLVTSIQTIRTKVVDLETAANAMESRMTTAEERYKDLLKKCEELTIKTDLLENQSRKFNLRILGLPRGIEGPRATAFTSALLYELFGEEALGPPPIVNIAHRTGPTNKDGNRCMIVRMNSFDVRLTIQRLVGNRGGKLAFRGHTIRIYPDISADLRGQQAEFNAVRTRLRELA